MKNAMRNKSLSGPYFKNLGPGKRFMLGRFILEVTSGCPCIGCFLSHKSIDCYQLRKQGFIPQCQGAKRPDKQDVVFKEVKNEK